MCNHFATQLLSPTLLINSIRILIIRYPLILMCLYIRTDIGPSSSSMLRSHIKFCTRFYFNRFHNYRSLIHERKRTYNHLRVQNSGRKEKMKFIFACRPHCEFVFFQFNSFFLFECVYVCLFGWILTTIPQVKVIPRPQYVFGTMSPYPTHKNVMAVSHMAFSKFACSSSWNLRHFTFFLNDHLFIYFYAFKFLFSIFSALILFCFLDQWKTSTHRVYVGRHNINDVYICDVYGKHNWWREIEKSIKRVKNNIFIYKFFFSFLIYCMKKERDKSRERER